MPNFLVKMRLVKIDPTKRIRDNWTEFVMSRQFETLDWFPGAKELLDFVNSLNVKWKFYRLLLVLSITVKCEIRKLFG
jgi:hypothetical protein